MVIPTLGQTIAIAIWKSLLKFKRIENNLLLIQDTKKIIFFGFLSFMVKPEW